MKENTQEKSLIQVNEKSIFYKIKRFFRNLFHRNQVTSEVSIVEQEVENENPRNSFIETIKNIEDDETRLLKLQKQYENGEIKEEDLTKEQYSSLCNLYDKQIDDLKKSNEIRRQKLLKYRRNLQTDS